MAADGGKLTSAHQCHCHRRCHHCCCRQPRCCRPHLREVKVQEFGQAGQGLAQGCHHRQEQQLSPHIQTALWRRQGQDEPHGNIAGLRGQRGKDVRRMVYNGVLRVGDGAHAVVRGVLAEYLLGNAATATATSGGGRNGATAVMTMAALLQRGFWQWSDMAMTAGDG